RTSIYPLSLHDALPIWCQTGTARGDASEDEALTLIEQVVRRENLVVAHARVVRNSGAPGVDGMTVEDLLPYCRQHWARIREQLLDRKSTRLNSSHQINS